MGFVYLDLFLAENIDVMGQVEVLEVLCNLIEVAEVKTKINVAITLRNIVSGHGIISFPLTLEKNLETISGLGYLRKLNFLLEKIGIDSIIDNNSEYLNGSKLSSFVSSGETFRTVSYELEDSANIDWGHLIIQQKVYLYFSMLTLDW